MKKLLMASIILFLFAASVLLLQTSCSKTEAQTNNNAISQVGKIIYIKKWSIDAQIWTANYDGTNATQIPLALPSGVSVDANCCSASLTISPDGQKIFFSALNTSSGSSVTDVYSCNIDGSGLSLVIPGTSDMLGKVQAY